MEDGADDVNEQGAAHRGRTRALTLSGERKGESGIAPFAAPRPLRQRHDGFTAKKRKKFFKALKKTGCIADACRVAGISRNTVRRHRDKWPAFDAKVEATLAMASVDLEAIAWKRAVEGVEEKVIRDGKVAWIRIKPSDSILRLLMQGANPKKYGRIGGEPKRSIERRLREEITREVRAKELPQVASNEEVLEALVTRLKAFGVRVSAELAGQAEEIRARRIAQGLPVMREGRDWEEDED